MKPVILAAEYKLLHLSTIGRWQMASSQLGRPNQVMHSDGAAIAAPPVMTGRSTALLTRSSM